MAGVLPTFFDGEGAFFEKSFVFVFFFVFFTINFTVNVMLCNIFDTSRKLWKSDKNSYEEMKNQCKLFL